MTSREWGVMTPGSSGDTAADHSPRSWWRGRSLHPRATSIITSPPRSPGRFFSHRLARPHRPLLPLPLSFLPPLILSSSVSSISLSFSRLLFPSSYSQMRSRGMSWLGPSCPPIIILTGFNLNNAACGFHRHARARLIISRTNSPTRYPSMVYHPTSYHYIFPSRLLLLLTRAPRDHRRSPLQFSSRFSRTVLRLVHADSVVMIPEFILLLLFALWRCYSSRFCRCNLSENVSSCYMSTKNLKFCSYFYILKN